MRALQTVNSVIRFYVDGFRNMKLGKTLWAIIGIKMFIFLVVLKTLFFPNHLKENFATDQERSEYILNNLAKGVK